MVARRDSLLATILNGKDDMPQTLQVGPASFSAYRYDTANMTSVLHATAVNIQNGEMLCKIVRFYHDLPRTMENRVSG